MAQTELTKDALFIALIRKLSGIYCHHYGENNCEIPRFCFSYISLWNSIISLHLFLIVKFQDFTALVSHCEIPRFRCHCFHCEILDFAAHLFLAATKQLYDWFSPSVCPSVRPSVRHTFFTMFPSSYHHEIFRSYYHGQKWCPCKSSRSEVKGQGHRGQHPT